MENKNNTFIVGLGAIIIGLVGGYFIGMGRISNESISDQPKCGVSSGMHDVMGGMMTGLEGKTGDALDLAFLDEMIVHHEGAIAMAQSLLKGTKRPELIKLGNDIITAQTGEIKMMKDWRKTWFNK